MSWRSGCQNERFCMHSKEQALNPHWLKKTFAQGGNVAIDLSSRVGNEAIDSRIDFPNKYIFKKEFSTFFSAIR